MSETLLWAWFRAGQMPAERTWRDANEPDARIYPGRTT
jgi:hypothetical protein